MKKLILTLFLLLLSNTYILAANSGIGIEVVKFVDSINIKWLKTVDKWSIKKTDNFFNRINKSITENKKMLIKNK